MKKIGVFITCALLIINLITLAEENVTLGESVTARDNYIRTFITSKVLKNGDINFSLNKLSLDESLKKLETNEIQFITVNNVDFLKDYPNLEAIRYHQVFVGVIVNKDNPISEMSFDDLAKIFNNGADSWSFLNPENNYSIHRFGLNKEFPTYAIAESAFPAVDGKDNLLYYPLDSNKDIAIMVESNNNSIGLIELEKNDRYLNKVKLINIKDAKNRLVMNYYLVFKKSEKKRAEEFLKNE